MNGIETLIESASERRFTEFDAETKTILENKIANRLNEMGYFSRLDNAKGLTEKSEEDTEYQKKFRKVMKKFGISSPKELEGDKEKTEKFYAEVEKIKKD
jgi:hypothetical protein